IQRKVASYYTESGKKYVPRLYRVFENPKKYGIPNAALPAIEDMTDSQLKALGHVKPEMAEDVLAYTQKDGKAAGLTSPGVKIGGERFKGRTVTDEAYRRALGEIQEPAYPVAKGIAQVGKDVANAEFLDAVSKNTDWVSPTAKAGYKQIPGDAKKYGALAGKYLKANLADEMNSIFQTKGVHQKAYEALLSRWKFGKVVLNPATHMRNMMSNAMLLDMSG